MYTLTRTYAHALFKHTHENELQVAWAVGYSGVPWPRSVAPACTSCCAPTSCAGTTARGCSGDSPTLEVEVEVADVF
jgi:hypothetical protein